MNTHSIKSILVIALFLSITLAACLPGEEDIFWQQVSPPPGYDGSCYAYFKTEGYADLKHGFSSVWCELVISDDPEVIQLEWEPVPNPPGVSGRCYAYFKTEGYADLKHGFSGAWCY